jgi:hypothetical protein
VCKLVRRIERWCGCSTEPRADDLVGRTETAISRASQFLVSRQGDDGAWRSGEDQDLVNGHALTPHVLRALRGAPQPASVGDAVARGCDFVESIISADDRVDTGSPVLPFPMTATAGALYLLAGSGRARRDALMPVLVDELCAGQYDEQAGYVPDDVEYGGFGYQPAFDKRDMRERIPELNHPHLSAGMYVVEALALSGQPRAREALAKARIFVERCQNYGGTADGPDDGGFVFSPAIAGLNKAGEHEGTATGFRSYGTMTANGVRQLLLLGYGVEHPRLRAGADWLARNFRVDAVPGGFPADHENARAAVYHYYLWTLSCALDALGRSTVDTPRGPVGWAREIANELVDRQLPDGRWQNVAAARKENLVPVADMQALSALAVCRGHLP